MSRFTIGSFVLVELLSKHGSGNRCWTKQRTVAVVATCEPADCWGT